MISRQTTPISKYLAFDIGATQVSRPTDAVRSTIPPVIPETGYRTRVSRSITYINPRST